MEMRGDKSFLWRSQNHLKKSQRDKGAHLSCCLFFSVQTTPDEACVFSDGAIENDK
jgi:hypothetical protein